MGANMKFLLLLSLLLSTTAQAGYSYIPTGQSDNASSAPVALATDANVAKETGGVLATISGYLSSISSAVSTAANQVLELAHLSTISSNTAGLPDVTSTGNLGSLNSTLALSTVGKGTFLITITGTWSGTVTFQCAGDSVPTFTATTAAPAFTFGALVSTATANGSWIVPSAGFQQCQAKMTAYTSGTAAVTVTASQATRFGLLSQLRAASTPTCRLPICR